MKKMNKQQISLQVEFEKDDLQKIKFSAKTKILGGNLAAIDFDGLAFKRSNLLGTAIELLEDIHDNYCLYDNPTLEERLEDLLKEIKKLEGES